jgi:hypothetical protein
MLVQRQTDGPGLKSAGTAELTLECHGSLSGTCRNVNFVHPS